MNCTGRTAHKEPGYCRGPRGLPAVGCPPGEVITPSEGAKAKVNIAASTKIYYLRASDLCDLDENGDVSGVMGQFIAENGQFKEVGTVPPPIKCSRRQNEIAPKFFTCSRQSQPIWRCKVFALGHSCTQGTACCLVRSKSVSGNRMRPAVLSECAGSRS